MNEKKSVLNRCIGACKSLLHFFCPLGFFESDLHEILSAHAAGFQFLSQILVVVSDALVIETAFDVQNLVV